MADRKIKKSISLCLMKIFLLCLIASHHVTAAPQPMPPGMIYRDVYEMQPPSQILIDRLIQIVKRKEEKIEKEIDELAEEQMEIQALIDAKARSVKEHQPRPEFSEENTETLPVPAAIYHTKPLYPDKRTSYMALCHFKICNMGRKRQM